jgi:nucleoside-diphosphate-sugar epimerase
MRTIRDCNVAVVGGAGFLGSHLVNHLIEDRGCRVLVIDNLVAGRREFVHKEANFEHHDITGSEEHLRRLFDDCEFVFNYAAYPYIPVSFARPIHVCNVNFFGAMKVINAAQEAGVEAILQVSSAEIYGGYEGKTEKCDETTIVSPHSSYGVSKAAVDNWIQVRWKEAKTPCIALRQFNCVGERETHPYIVPEIIGQLSKQDGHAPVKAGGQIGTIRLGNNSFRDFLYAGDAVRIAVELLERGVYGEVYNLGSETGIKMYDLAKLIGKVMGFADVKVELDEARVRPWEIWWLQADVTKIRTAVNPMGNSANFKITPLEEALRRTVKWYESNGRKWPWEV